jgi:hypothetical protein
MGLTVNQAFAAAMTFRNAVTKAEGDEQIQAAVSDFQKKVGTDLSASDQEALVKGVGMLYLKESAFEANPNLATAFSKLLSAAPKEFEALATPTGFDAFRQRTSVNLRDQPTTTPGPPPKVSQKDKDDFSLLSSMSTAEPAKVDGPVAQKIVAPLSKEDAQTLATITDTSLSEALRKKYPAATADRRQMAMGLGGDDFLLHKGHDTRMSQTLAECREVNSEKPGGPYKTVSDLMTASAAQNHASPLLAINSPTGKHLLRPNQKHDGLEVATPKGWAPVDDAWVKAQRFDDTCDVGYANAAEKWTATTHAPNPGADRPFYYERGGGDTCAITAINNFCGKRAAMPSQYKAWAEVEFAKDLRKLPKTDPEHYASEQIPASPGADGVGPADLKGFAAHLGLGELAIETGPRDTIASYLDKEAESADRFIIGRPANTHFYALRKHDDGRWYLLDNRAPAQVSYATPGAWVKSLAEYEDLYALHLG